MHLSFQRMVQFFCIPSIKKETTNLVTKELRASKKHFVYFGPKYFTGRNNEFFKDLDQ